MPEDEAREPISDEDAQMLKMLRPSRRMGLEELLAQELALATMSAPLDKIRHICEGCMLLNERERARVRVNGEEFEEVKRIHTLGQTLQNAHINRELSSRGVQIDSHAIIPWPFPAEAAVEWMGKWIGDKFLARYYSRTPQDTEELERELKDSDNLQRVYAITREQRTTMDTYKGLIIRYTDYAMPKAAQLLRKIISLVSMDVYLKTLESLRGAKKSEKT